MINRKISLFFFYCFIFLVSIASCFGSDKSAINLAAESKLIDESIIAPADQLGKAYAAIANHVSPAVVSIFSEKILTFYEQDVPFFFDDNLFKDFFGDPSKKSKKNKLSKEYRIPQKGLGSGMFLDRTGLILTNYHVVHDVQEISVQFYDQKLYEAKIIGIDPKSDVAIIQVQGHGFENYPTVNLGNSDLAYVGEIVLAIGAPFGLSQTVTHGIISATSRTDVGVSDYEDFLQTDAPINPGNSGGPLVNWRGEVIGMNSAIATKVGQSGGVGFSIPINMIKSILPQLSKGQTIVRAELGMVIQNLTEDIARHFELKDTKGVLISKVFPDSLAEKSGLIVEDIITHYDEKPVDGVHTLRKLIAQTALGSKVKVIFLRDGKSKNIFITIQEENTKQAGSIKKPVVYKNSGQLGITVENITKELADFYHIKAQTGVLVTDIDDYSPAIFAGLRIGDIILKSNHKQLSNKDDFIKSSNHKNNKNNYLFLVERFGENIFISIHFE
ncbi:MAG: Do family serine endopeptidase [Pseudobdellovibrio sp.]